MHRKIISIFSSTPPSSPQESNNFPSPDIIHLSYSKELFLICLLLFSLRLRRPLPTPPAIISLTSLCFPGLIASRIRLIFWRRKSRFVKIKSAARDKEGGKKRRGEGGLKERATFQVQFTNTDGNFSTENKPHEPSSPYQFKYMLSKLHLNTLTLTSRLLLPKASFHPESFMHFFKP